MSDLTWAHIPTLTVCDFTILCENMPAILAQYGPNYFNVRTTIQAWTSLLSDSPLLDFKTSRQIKRFAFALAHDLFGSIKLYTSLAHTLLSTLVVNADGIIDIPYIKAFEKTPIYKEYVAFRKTGNPAILQFIVSFLRFGSKLYYEDEKFQDTAFRKWLEVEDRISAIDIPEWVSELKRAVQFLLRSWSDTDFLPSHGSGAVSERSVHGIHQKTVTMTYSPPLAHVYGSKGIAPYKSAYSPDPDGRVIEELSDNTAHRTARLMFVPKDWKTSRSICMEPAAYMWAQQGVRKWLEDAMITGPLQSFVKLSDQAMNRSAAEYGSMTQKVDTIDLSSASDSVSWKLVKSVFPAGVLKHLMATRTSVVDTGDRLVPVAKFAPMGSAVCFPVQTILYSAVCLLEYGRYVGCNDYNKVVRAYTCDRLTTGTTLLQPFRVYGDDIICDSRITSNIIERLQSLGFEVNVGKSFMGPQAFRESCGGWFFNGHDITPFQFKTKRLGKRINVEELGSLIDNANLALEMGFSNLNAFLKDICYHVPVYGIRGKRNPILESSVDTDESFTLRTDNVDNSHLRERHYIGGRSNESHDRYQRDEWLSVMPTVRNKRAFSHENYLYNAWCRSVHHRTGVDRMAHIRDQSDPACRYDTQGVGIAWRWTPKRK